MAASDILREQLQALVDGLDARMPFDAAVADFPEEAINSFPPNVPYTPWQLLEHLRMTQGDILDYIRNRAYLAPSWPEEYWPAHDATATLEQFAATIDGSGQSLEDSHGSETVHRRRRSVARRRAPKGRMGQ